MNQPSKFTIKKPRITLTDEQKKQARSGMAGEAVKSGEEAEATRPIGQPVEEPAAAIPEEPATAQGIPEPTPQQKEEIPLVEAGRQSRGRGRKPAKPAIPPVEESDTQHVRMSKDAVMRAKMNVLLLPPNMGIRSLRDYGDAAFEFFEAHLRKSGKLPNY